MKFLPQTDIGLLSFRVGPCQKKLETFSGNLSARGSKGREQRRPLSIGNGMQAGHGKISPACLGEVIQICMRRMFPTDAPPELCAHKILWRHQKWMFFGKEWDYNCGNEPVGRKIC